MNSHTSTISDAVDKGLNRIDRRTVFASLIAIYATKQIYSMISAHNTHKQLIQQAEEKRRQRDVQLLNEFTPTIEIPEELNNLVLNSTVTQLLQLLNDDKVTSEQVLRIYHNRTVLIGLKLGLIAESNFPEALRTAKEYDIIRQNTPKDERFKLGSLFGLPISIKDSIQQKGLDSTSGLARFCFKPCEDDGVIIKLLKAQGAIPFIRTNLSQMLRSFDCSNNIWGRGLNPWNNNRSVGGSSGGDAGLIASRCTPISFGSDIYGSIRLPAAFAGVYGFKPSSRRYPIYGHSATNYYDALKFSVLSGSIGPLSKSVDDIVQVVRGLIKPENRRYDSVNPVILWNEEKYSSKRKFKIGYVLSEDFFEAAKPCKRAVMEAVEVLREAGHDVVEIKIPNFEEMSLNIMQLLMSDGKSRGLDQGLGGEKPNDDLSLQVTLGKVPLILKRIIRYFVHERTKSIIDYSMEPSVNEISLLVAKLLTLKKEYLKFWTSIELDAVITPAVALPAFKHGYGSKLLPASCYLWPANLCDQPAGVVPVTQVLAGEDVYDSKNSKHINDSLYKWSQECMEGSVGLPVGVQVLGLPWEEEKCLAVMKVIEDKINFNKIPNVA